MNKALTTALIALAAGRQSHSRQLYEVPAGVETPWISFENPTGAKGDGGKSAAAWSGQAATTRP